MLTLRELSNTYPEQIWLKLSEKLQEEAWQESQYHSHATIRCNAYLNYLCLYTFLPWLEAWFEEQVVNIKLFQESFLPSIWEFLNGSLIEIGAVRLALIPSETTDLEEFCVPQEWVDIPSWRADYYLAAQVNIDSQDKSWLRLWGYINHEQLKQKGIYEESDRAYYLDPKYLAEDLTLMLLEPQPVMSQLVEVEMLSSLSSAKVDKLLNKLGQDSLYSPRLAINFEEWVVLITNQQWRQELYQRRIGKLAATTQTSQSAINLREWLKQVGDMVEAGWQQFESLVSPLELSTVRGEVGIPETVTKEAIAPVINLLQANQPEQIRCQAAGVLGQIGADYPEAIDALRELLHTAQDEETRWQAALSLGRIAPTHPEAGVRKARIVDLGLQLRSHKLILIVAIMPKTNGKIGVWLQVQPSAELTVLPPHLKLTVLSASGETRLEAEARSNEQGRGKDKSLERRFSPPSGTIFKVNISLEGVSISEDFIA